MLTVALIFPLTQRNQHFKSLFLFCHEGNIFHQEQPISQEALWRVADTLSCLDNQFQENKLIPPWLKVTLNNSLWNILDRIGVNNLGAIRSFSTQGLGSGVSTTVLV